MTMPVQFPALQQRGLAKFIKLALDFSANETLDPRITFSRTSNATRTNAQGLVEYAPHNLLTYSENFDNAVWAKSNATVTANAIVAPDGTLTADKLVENTVNAQHLTQQLMTPNAGTKYTLSFYVKAAERSYCLVGFSGGGLGADCLLGINLTTGVSSSTSGAPESTNIVSIGSNWYRVSITKTLPSASLCGFRVMPSIDGITQSYTGDGTSGIYIWGAQLNIDSLQPYYATSVKNLLGYSQNFENAAWTKSNSNVLTNLLTYSQEFDNAVWTKSNATVTANAIVAPDGTTTADKLVEDTATNTHLIQQTPTYQAGTIYTHSVYAKAGERTFLQLRTTSTSTFSASFDLVNGTYSQLAANTTAVITSVGNGWFRCSITFTALASAAGATRIGVMLNDTTQSYTGDGTSGIYIWGAQLVQGTNPEEYTVTTSATAPIQVMGPLGFLGAEKLVEDTATSSHRLRQIIAVNTGTPMTISIYAKAGERNSFDLFDAYTSKGAYFNLANGTVTPPQSSGLTFASNTTINNLGYGWYRCSVTTTTNTTSISLSLLISDGSTTTYTGDGTSGIYIFGAQLSDSASLDPYSYNFGAAPTSSAYYGPRFDYDPVTLAPKGLLIEEARTNLLTYSSEFDNAVWVKSNATVTANAIAAPDGTITADKISYSGASTSPQQTLSSTTTTYCFSAFVKKGNTSFCRLRLGATVGGSGTSLSVHFNIDTGIVSAVGPATADFGSITPSITQAANGFYRISITFTVLTATTSIAYSIIAAQVSGGGSSNGDEIYIWGAQLEAGSFPTSYIPTTTAQVTRAADNASMVGTNFSSWYNQSEGTVAAEYDVILNTGGPVIFDIGAGGVFGTSAYGVQSNSYIGLLPGLAPVNMQSIVYTTSLTNKIAAGLQTNNSTISVNTVLGTTDTSCNMPASATTLTLGCSQFGGVFGNFLNGHIKSFKFFSKRFINTYLQSLTQ